MKVYYVRYYSFRNDFMILIHYKLAVWNRVSDKYIRYHFPCEIRFSSIKSSMVSHGTFSISRKGVSESQFRRGYENNRSAVSSLKSPLDWSWRMNTCLAMLRFQFQPRRHVLPRAPSTWSIIIILSANRQILNIEIYFCREAGWYKNLQILQKYIYYF